MVLNIFFCIPATSAKVTIAASAMSGKSVPTAIPLDSGRPGQGGASSGDFHPDPVQEPLVSNDDLAKMKKLFQNIYAFTIVSCPLICILCYWLLIADLFSLLG